MIRNVVCSVVIIFFFDIVPTSHGGLSNDFALFGFPAVSLSEPSVMLLVGCGLIGLAGFARKKIQDARHYLIDRNIVEGHKEIYRGWA